MSQRRLRSEELLVSAGNPQPSDGTRDELILGSHTVAHMSSEFGRVNALRSTSAMGMPAIEVLAGLTSQHPTGVVLIEHGEDGLAFCLDQGRVVGAYGRGHNGLLEVWCEKAQAQGIRGRPGASTWVGLMGAFIDRCVLERLALATTVGSNLTVIRGEVEWADPRLELADAVSLSHLLMEHAREGDDAAKYAKRLEPHQRYVFPTMDPADAATSGVFTIEEVDSECSFAGLAEDIDVDDNKHHDMAVVWSLCDGNATIADLADQCLLGRARTLAAVDRLRKKGCIELTTGHVANPVMFQDPEPPRQPAIDLRRLQAQYRDPNILQDLIESFIGNMPDWLAELDGAAGRNERSEYARVCGHIMGAGGAVAADQLLEAATYAQAQAFRSDTDLIGPLEAIEAAYAEAFRGLLSIHASP